MSSTGERRPQGRLLRKVRGYVRRRWNTKEYVTYFKSLVDPPSDSAWQNDEFLFRIATVEDVPWMSEHLHAWASWCRGGAPVANIDEVVREQFGQRDITVVGAENRPDGALVYVVWLCHDDFAFTLLPDDATAESHMAVRRVWVPPDYRGKGLATGGQVFAEGAATARGLKGLWSFVRTDNPGSLALHQALGYEDRGRARIVTQLKRRYAGIRLDPAADWPMKRIPYSISHL
jgi:GNAT superfamily N-acetyltransferase